MRPIVEGLAAATTGAIRIPGDLNRPWLVDGFPAFVAANEVSRNGVITGLVGANMACTRRVFSELGGFDAELGPGALGFGQDSVFGWRILAAGGSIQWLPGAVVWHHFDSSRLTLRSLVRTAVRMGRFEAYLHHQWHQRPLLALAALVPRALRLAGALLAKRYFGPPGWTGSGTPEYWILPLVATWSYLVQRLRESGRPRKYAPGCPADRV